MTSDRTGAPRRALLALLVLTSSACDLDGSVAPRVELAVIANGDGLVDFVTNEGYTIHLTRMRVAFENVEFTTSGELHAALWRPLVDLVIPSAYAHPGHYAGGEVIGEVNGRFVVDWLAHGQVLGDATLLQGQYDGANFVFTRGRGSDGLPVGDALLGHTFDIAGEASKDGQVWSFSTILDQDEGRRVVGLPLDLEVDGGTDVTLGLQLLPVDPFEGDTAFDNLDFAALDEDGDLLVALESGDGAYNTLRKQLQVHDIYYVTVE